VIGWLPWLLWQAGHDWPQLEVSASIAEGGSASSQPRWAFLPFQVLLVGPVLAPVWVAGLLGLSRDPALRPYRCLAWTWAVLAALFIATGGKPYYLGGLLPLLTGAGALSAERWLERGRTGARRATLAVAVGTSAAVCGAIGLPLLPAGDAGPVVAANPDAGETIGWPAFARSVAEVRDAMPDGRSALILTANYGQAGAIDRFGPALGLPEAYSGHNGYGEWQKPPGARGPVILIGFADGAYRDRRFRGCTPAGDIETEPPVDNEEDGTPMWICAGPRKPWRELWPSLRRLG